MLMLTRIVVIFCVVSVLAPATAEANENAHHQLENKIPALVVNHLLGKITVKSFCKKAEELRAEKGFQSVKDAPWMRPFRKLIKKRCGTRI